jgi:hypothetical protein
LLYYPRQVVDESTGFTYTCGLGFQDLLPACDSTYTNSSVDSSRMLERNFGGPNGICKAVNNTPTNGTKPTSNAGARKPAMLYGIVVTLLYLIM